MKIITKSQIVNVQPELKLNSELQPIAPTSSPTIGNTLVMRRPTSFHRKLLQNNQQLSIKVQQQKQVFKVSKNKCSVNLNVLSIGSVYKLILSALVNHLLFVHRKLLKNNQQLSIKVQQLKQIKKVKSTRQT